MAGTSDRPTDRIDWERFWVSRTGNVDLSDSGFMVDPTSPYPRKRLLRRPFLHFGERHLNASRLLNVLEAIRNFNLKAPRMSFTDERSAIV
jgi:hypothetical protein